MLRLLVALSIALWSPAALAVPFELIRSGDVDGFGFASTSGLVNGNGGPADTDGDGMLEVGEFLPDINEDGGVAAGSGDDFNNRSAAEAANTFFTGAGFTPVNVRGSAKTDRSLTSSNSVFEFDFSVGLTDISPTTDLILSVVYGDYDTGQGPVEMLLTLQGGSTLSVPLIPQSAGEKGLIQEVTVDLSFADVFVSSGTEFDGFLRVDVSSGNEAFMAFDWMAIAVPEPSIAVLIGLSFIAAVAIRRM